MKAKLVRLYPTACFLSLICLLVINAQAQSPESQLATSWPSQASQYRLHVIGNAHIDAPWLWPWSESMASVHSTFRSVLNRMNEYPDFTFTASSGLFYEWVAQTDPGMMEEIRKRVEEGRWRWWGDGGSSPT